MNRRELIVIVFLFFYFGETKSQLSLDKIWVKKATEIDAKKYSQCTLFTDTNECILYELHYEISSIKKVGLSESNSSIWKYVGTWTANSDTVILNDEVICFNNPFPNVFLHKEFLDGNKSGPKALTTTGYTWVMQNGKIIEACVRNDSLGTLKYYYDTGVIVMEGHYRKNKKNDVWIFRNLKNEIIRKEYFDKGILLKTENF